MSQRFDGPAGAQHVRLASRRNLIRRTTMLGLVAMLAWMLASPQSAHAQGLLQRWFGRPYHATHSHQHIVTSPADGPQQRPGLASQAAATAAADYVDGNLRQAGDNAIGLTLESANQTLGKAWNGYQAVQAANQVVNSGTPGSPVKALTAAVAADAALGGVLTQAGVGPQAAFIAGFADTATKFTMNKQEEGTAALSEGFAQQHLDTYRQTGDPRDVARSAIAAKPDVKYRDLESWNGRGVLEIKPNATSDQPLDSATLTVPDLSAGWTTTVKKPDFQTKAEGLLGRVADWLQWKLDPNNIEIKSNFDRTIVGNDGTTHVQIEQTKTGYGYEPGQTNRSETVRTEFHGKRVETQQPIRVERADTAKYRSPSTSPRVQTPRPSHAVQTYSRPSISRPAYSRPTVSRPSFSTPSFSRPSFSTPSFSRPSFSTPSFSRPSFSSPSFPR